MVAKLYLALPQQWPTIVYSESAPKITHQPAFEIPSTSPRDPTHLYNTFILASLQTFFTYFNLVIWKLPLTVFLIWSWDYIGEFLEINES